MKHYLIVLGSSTHAVRAGSGRDEASAALEAFGDYNPKTMTFKQISLQHLRTDKRRIAAIAELVREHVRRFPEHRARAIADMKNDGIDLYPVTPKNPEDPEIQ